MKMPAPSVSLLASPDEGEHRQQSQFLLSIEVAMLQVLLLLLTVVLPEVASPPSLAQPFAARMLITPSTPWVSPTMIYLSIS
jgi:hypothetical protein